MCYTCSMNQFPGEDRSFGGDALYVDMVPGGSWGANARTLLTEKSWRAVRAIVTARVTGCECCGAVGSLQAHERWDYAFPYQRLIRLVALCGACHDATHYGRASVYGRLAQVQAHLRHVNGWTSADLNRHLESAMAELAAKTHRGRWLIDLSILTDAGYTLRPQRNDDPAPLLLLT